VSEPSGLDHNPASPTVTRVKSGLIAVAILIPILLFGGFWGLLALAVAAAALGMREYLGIVMPQRAGGTLLLGIVLAAAMTVAVSLGRFDLLALAVAATVLGSTSWVLFTARREEPWADISARLIMGTLYVGALIGFLPLLRSEPGGAGWMWLAFGLGWCGDIGGYFAGREFGRHKMSPVISPKKTWEGFLGGVLLAIAWAVLFKLLFFPQLRTIDCLVLAVLGDVAGVVGDLVESVIKRTYKVKDSGRFLPGHGGLLDRIDSVMFTIPVTYAYVHLIVHTAG
jgi:phosphatidate cytidylyltransferase